jgi:hypothetical protein
LPSVDDSQKTKALSPMTPEQIQAAIEGMLAVQRELQDSQLRLLEQSKISERKLDRLIGYSITQE